jgi:selenocysteine lyase/cysteine desulfurase
MVIRRSLGERLPNQGHYFNGDTLYKRFTPAGPDHAQIAASAGIADYIDALHDRHFAPGPDARERAARVHDLLRAQEAEVIAPLLSFLADRNDVRLIGPSDPVRRAPTVAVSLGRPAEPVAEALAREGVNCWAGNFYAVRPLAAMGVDADEGVLRLSAVHYTSAPEIARTIAALERIL